MVGIDAPLGWSVPVAESLAHHSAGDHITTAPHDLFRRQTDRHIHRNIGKMPLDVGSDRIARTAHAALQTLHDLRRLTGKPIPLAWSHSSTGIVAIEVYPAATLSAHGFPSKNYKKVDQQAARQIIASRLAAVLEMPIDQTQVLNSADALDATVCLLAIKDFWDGMAIQPIDFARARREGWIWVRRPLRNAEDPAPRTYEARTQTVTPSSRARLSTEDPCARSSR